MEMENNLGRNMKFRRMQLGMTLDDVASRAVRSNGKNVTRPYINSLEKKHRNVSLEYIEAIAGALKTTPSELLAPGIPVSWLPGLPNKIREMLAKEENIPILNLTAEALEKGFLTEESVQKLYSFLEDAYRK